MSMGQGSEEELKLKQEVFRQSKAYEIIFVFLKEGQIVHEILLEISERRAHIHQAYRLDIFDLACKLFTYCYKIIYMFTIGNDLNKAVVAKHINIILSNHHANYGQLAILEGLMTDNPIDINKEEKDSVFSVASLAEPVSAYLTGLLKQHGHIPSVIKILLKMIEDSRQNTIILKKEILSRLLDSRSRNNYQIEMLSFDSPFDEQLMYRKLFDDQLLDSNHISDLKSFSAELSRFAFRYKQSQNMRTFEVLFVVLIYKCIGKASKGYFSKFLAVYPMECLLNNFSRTLDAINRREDKDAQTISSEVSGYLDGMVHIMKENMVSDVKGFGELISKSLEEVAKSTSEKSTILERIFNSIHQLSQVPIDYAERERVLQLEDHGQKRALLFARGIEAAVLDDPHQKR